jgi:hypothetical protein
MRVLQAVQCLGPWDYLVVGRGRRGARRCAEFGPSRFAEERPPRRSFLFAQLAPSTSQTSRLQTPLYIRSATHHAGLQTTPALGALQGRDQAVRDRLVPVRRDHQEPAHQRRHKGPLPGLHRQAGNVSGPMRPRRRCPMLTPHPVSTRSRPSSTVCAHTDTWPISSRTRIDTIPRHKGCWWNKPQEGWLAAPWSARLRQR